MNQLLKTGLLAIALTTALSACVTINIYFPTAAAEKAADRLIDEVWQVRENGKQGGTSTPASPANETDPQ
jgi:hypothetical protein